MPYRWITSSPSAAIWATVVGEGGAPPVPSRMGWLRVWGIALGSFASATTTVGAAQKCVTRSRSISDHTTAGWTLRSETWR
jgi:hypothetical protein